MSKPVHPVQKMRKAVRDAQLVAADFDREVEHILQRDIRPLLDALEESHLLPSPQGLICPSLNADSCPKCQILTRWKAPL